MADDQLPYLDTFLRAAELNGFTAAARALGLTQAAVSQRIQSLEQALGAVLFERHGGRALLTEAGRRLHPYAERILELREEALREVGGKQPDRTGLLTLAASSVPGEYLLPEFLSRFRSRHPHIQVRATVADSQVVLDSVERGEVHLGLVGKQGDSSHLEYRAFATDRLGLLVPGRAPWVRCRGVGLERFCRQPLILRERGSGSRQCLELALARAGRSLRDLRVVLELGSNAAIKEAVQHGLGAAILSARVVQDELQSGKVRLLSVSGLPLVRDLFAVWDRRRVLPIPSRLFLDLLQPPSSSRHS